MVLTEEIHMAKTPVEKRSQLWVLGGNCNHDICEEAHGTLDVVVCLAQAPPDVGYAVIRHENQRAQEPLQNDSPRLHMRSRTSEGQTLLTVYQLFA